MLGPGRFRSALLCRNLVCRQMMYWSHHTKELLVWAWLCFCFAYCLFGKRGVGGAEEWAWMRLYYLWGIACFSSMDIAGCGRRNKQTSSVLLPPPFLQGWACSQRRFCDWCLSMLGVYLFVWQTNALLTSHCHMLSSQCILHWHQCLFIQVQRSLLHNLKCNAKVRGEICICT